MASRRNRVVDNLIATLKAANGNKYEYRVVTRDPICEATVTKARPGEVLLGVYEINESKDYSFGYTTAMLEVIIEFYYKVKAEDNQEKQVTYVLNEILAQIIKDVMTDRQRGGEALNTEEVSNSLDIDGIYDKLVNGSATFTITYRHRISDPTTL